MTTCKSCEERRRAVMDAYLEGKIAEALKQAALGVKDMIGGKKGE